MALDTTHKVAGVTLYVYGDTSAEIGARPWHLAALHERFASAIQLGSHATRATALAAMWDLRDVIDATYKAGMRDGILNVATGE